MVTMGGFAVERRGKPEPLWYLTKDGDATCLELYRRHYSFKRSGHRRRLAQFVGPGEHMVLRTAEGRAMFVWRNYIDHTIPPQTGIECSVFRNEAPERYLSSELIKQADKIADHCWPHQRHYTKVDPAAVGSGVAGYCFIRAGWRRCGRTKGGLILLERKARPASTAKPPADDG